MLSTRLGLQKIVFRQWRTVSCKKSYGVVVVHANSTAKQTSASLLRQYSTAIQGKKK